MIKEINFENWGERYIAIISGIEVIILAQDFDDFAVQRAMNIVTRYDKKLNSIAEYLVAQETIQNYFNNPDTDEIIEKLGLPILYLYGQEGRLTYCNHMFDDKNIINLDFTGLLEEFISCDIEH